MGFKLGAYPQEHVIHSFGVFGSALNSRPQQLIATKCLASPLAHSQLLFQSPFLLVIGLAVLVGFVVLCKVYFFSVPLTGISIALACYVASIALSRA
jgi:hypothetical protein